MLMARFFFFLKTGFTGLCLAFMIASCATTAPSAPVVTRPQEPGWVTGGPHERFSNTAYLTAVGSGSSRPAAELDAFRHLVSTFGVSVQADIRLAETYRRTGAIATHEIAIGQEIVLDAGMDNLVGAEIGDRWETRGRTSTSFALAVLNRDRAAQIYTEMIRANLEMIDNLTNMLPAERNSLNGFSRYQFAAVIADMNTNYAAVLSVVGAPPVHGLRSGDDFRLSAQEIATAIPIGINIRNDRAGRIQSAFAAAFSDLGFRTGGTNPRYLLYVDVVLLPTEHSGRNVFARMELTANLTDTSTGAVLLPYTFNIREGHIHLSEAENRTFIVAERRINDEYRDMLSNYLSQLIPR